MRVMAESPWPPDTPVDVARRHHEYLAESYLDRHEPDKR